MRTRYLPNLLKISDNQEDPAVTDMVEETGISCNDSAEFVDAQRICLEMKSLGLVQ